MNTTCSSLEPLEDRIAPAVFVVTNLTDSNVSGSHSLRDAINQANLTDALDTITFAPSVHGTIPLGGSELPVITHPLIIKGPGANRLIIDASNNSPIFQINDGSAGTDSPVSISGLAMISGKVINSGGGAILSKESLTLKSCVVSGSTAVGAGGGVAVYATDLATQTVNVTKCLISGNSVTGQGYGGGLSLHAGKSVVISGCTVLGNSSTYEGGGAFVQIGGSGTGITISKSRFTGNTSVENGGGMFVTDFNNVDPNTKSKVTISSTIVSGNSGSFGGGIYLQDGNFVLSGVTVRANTAMKGGGGIDASLASSLTITGGSITGNLASGNDGGGLRIDGGVHPLTISGAHITDNHASGNGGGIFLNNAGVVKLSGIIVAGNTAVNNGGGLEDDNSTSTSVFGGEFADNAAGGGGGGLDIAGPAVDIHSTKITGNTGNSGGGAFLDASSTLTIIGAIVTGNESLDNHGGGLRLAGNGVLTMKSGLISGNHADTDGGGIYTSDLSGTITGVKITGNAANNFGGGIDQNTGTVTLGPGEAALVTGNFARSLTFTGPDRNGI